MHDATGTTSFFTFTGHPLLIGSDFNLYYVPFRDYSHGGVRGLPRIPRRQ